MSIENCFNLNFREEIEKSAFPEPIEAIVIDTFCRFFDDGEDDKHRTGDSLAGRILSWPEARAALDYYYDSGYGSQDCHDICAYTPTRVIFVHEYDGSTSLHSVPRNPTPKSEE